MRFSGKVIPSRCNLLLAVLAISLVLYAPPAEATVFDGACNLNATGRVDDPQPGVQHHSVRGEGLCFGILNGHRLPLRGTPVVLQAEATNVNGCPLAADLPFEARLTFLRELGRPQLRLVDLSHVYALVRGALVARGATSGAIAGTTHANGGLELLEDCLAGRLREIPISTQFNSIGPLEG